MRFRLPFLATSFFLSTFLSAAPSVSRLTAVQRSGTQWVDLTYDLDGGGFGAIRVTLEISSDGGTTYAVPVASATGAVGEGVTPGPGKSIAWNAEADWSGNSSEEMRFRLVADEGFAEVPGGSFVMGATSGDPEVDAPATPVTLSTFYLQETETTKAQWDSVRIWALAHGYPDLPPGGGKAANHPVQGVSWCDVVKWCNARSEKEGLSPCYTLSGAVIRSGTAEPEVDWSANGYRLPTEAEWEKAARGGISGKRFPWGTDLISHDEANYLSTTEQTYDRGVVRDFHPTWKVGEAPYTAPVGSFARNAYGLHDMAGNVWEWCWDRYDGAAYAQSAGAIDPKGATTGPNRVLRGGSWNRNAASARAGHRLSQAPAVATGNDGGFRPARGRLVDGFASVPGGTFQMGPTNGDAIAGAQPIEVTVSPFTLQTDETTWTQWSEVRAWALTRGYTDLSAGGGKGASHPVHSVSWFDVVKWCNARSEKEGLLPCYTVGGVVFRTGEEDPEVNWSANGHRLPTEAEWERAARGGVIGARFPWGGNLITHLESNYRSSTTFLPYDTSSTRGYHGGYTGGGFPYTAPVGSFAANGYGLRDMAGNVSEWCWDWHDDFYYTTSHQSTDPRGPAMSGYRVTRGGGWSTYADHARAAHRAKLEPDGAATHTGFRPGRNLMPDGGVGGGVGASADFTVDSRAFATIDLAGLSQTYNGAPRSAGASTTPEGLAVTFTYDGSTTAPTEAGSYEVIAQIDDPRFQGRATGTLVVVKASQVITFDAISHQLSTATLTLSATGGPSGQSVVFTVADGPGLIEGGNLSFTGAGVVGVTASQAGDENHESAASVTRSFTVSKANASVLLTGLNQVYDGQTKVAGSTTTPPGLTVDFTYDDSVSPPSEVGTYAVVGRISHPLYQGSASRALVISPAGQTLVFGAGGDRFLSEVVTLAATGGASGNAVTFSVVSGPGTITGGNRLAFTGEGRVTLVAHQEGGGNFAAAAPQEASFQVVLPRPDVAVGASVASLTGKGSFTLPSGQQILLTSRKVRPVNAHASVANRALLPDRRAADSLSVIASRGGRFFRVTYHGREGNLTAGVIGGTYRTPAIDESDGALPLRAVVKPNKKKLTQKKGPRMIVRKKTFTSLIQAASVSLRSAQDSGLIRVRTR